MPTYANPLYANGVPTYSNEVGALADVFKALAPNPLRDLQIQGYASNARLHKLQGDVIANQQGGLSRVANALRANDYQEIGPAAVESGNLQFLDNIYKAGPAQLAMRGLTPGQPALSDAEQQAVATAVGATGGNVANTFYGFDRTANEINRNNTLMSGDRRYGSQLSLQGVLAGVGEDARWHNMQGAENTRNNNMTNSRGMAVISEDARNHLATDATNRRGQDFDQSNKFYESNLSNLFKQPGSGSSATEMNDKDIEQLQAASQLALDGLDFPADRKAELAALIQANYLAQPKGGRNYQLAANQAIAAFQKGPTLADSVVDDWGPTNSLGVRADTPPLPAPWQPPAKVPAGGARGADGLTQVARTVLQGNPDLTKALPADVLRGPGPTAPLPAPATPPVDATQVASLLTDAKAAINQRAPREAVIAELRARGVPDQAIQAAGI